MVTYQPSSTSSLPDKDTLEREKLRREIEALERPYYKTHSFWLSLATAIAALVGIVGQSYVSEYKNLKAQYEQREAQAKRDQADLELRGMKREIAVLLKTKQNLSAGLESVTTAIANTEAANNPKVQNAVLEAANAAFTVQVYAYGVDKSVLDQAIQGLSASGYTLTGSALLPNHPSWLALEPSILYYSDISSTQAQAVAKLLQERTGISFKTARGAGLGVSPEERPNALRVHIVRR